MRKQPAEIGPGDTVEVVMGGRVFEQFTRWLRSQRLDIAAIPVDDPEGLPAFVVTLGESLARETFGPPRSK